MEQLKQGSDALFILLGAIMVLAMHAGFAFLELGTVRKKNQVNALVKILVDFSVSTVAYFFVGYTVAYGVSFFTGAEHAGGEERLRAGQVLLPADLRGGDSGHRLRRHRRARALRPAARSPPRVLVGARSIRCSKASPGTATSACRRWIKAIAGAEFHDFAGSVVVHAVGGWVGLVGGAAARRAQQPLPQGRRDQRASAVEHPVSRARRVGADGRLVRLQRDERADDRQDLGAGRGELADGDGRRHAGGRAARPQRPRLRAQRPARRAGGGVRRLRRDASGRRAGRRRRGRRDLRRACSR